MKPFVPYTPASGELSEQFDRNTGAQTSARHLAWSYAAFLSCVAARRRRHDTEPRCHFRRGGMTVASVEQVPLPVAQRPAEPLESVRSPTMNCSRAWSRRFVLLTRALVASRVGRALVTLSVFRLHRHRGHGLLADPPQQLEQTLLRRAVAARHARLRCSWACSA